MDAEQDQRAQKETWMKFKPSNPHNGQSHVTVGNCLCCSNIELLACHDSHDTFIWEQSSIRVLFRFIERLLQILPGHSNWKYLFNMSYDIKFPFWMRYCLNWIHIFYYCSCDLVIEKMYPLIIPMTQWQIWFCCVCVDVINSRALTVL